MKKNYLKKNLRTISKVVMLCFGIFTFGSVKAQLTDLSYSATGGLFNNAAINQVIFGNVDPNATIKSKDMLVVGYTTSNISTGAYVSGPYVKIYKNTGTAPYYNETDVITNIPAWVNTNWVASNAVRQYTGNFAAWSKKDSKILVTGSDGTNKYSKLFKPDGLGGYAEIVNPVGGTTPFEGVIGYCGFGDFDADGDDDILLYDTGLNTSTRALGYARVYRNDGADNYTLMTLNMPYTVQNFYSIAISDTNGDGRDDIAINGVYNLTSNTAANYRTALYTPDASMAFTEVIPKVAAANIRQIAYGAVAFIDTDGDGVASDIIMAGGQGNTTSARRFTLYKRNAAVPLTDDNAYTVEFDYATTDGAFNAVGFQYGMIAVGDLSGSGQMKDFVSIGQRNSNSNRPYVGIKRTSGYTIYNNLEVTTNAAISSYNGNTAPNTSFFGNIINGGGSSVLRAYAIGDVDADGKADDLATFALEYFGAASLKVSSTLYVNDETVLPITGLEFTVKAESNGAKLNWSTATEKDNSHFIISRSTDGSKFTPIATITGSGTSNATNNYQFVDIKPLSGVNYYKLQQVDFNGTITDLGVKSVRFGLSASTLVVYPNPTKGIATVTLMAGAYTTYTVVGVQGNTVATGKIGNGATTVNIELSSAPKGTYIVKLFGTSGSSAARVIKL